MKKYILILAHDGSIQEINEYCMIINTTDRIVATYLLLYKVNGKSSQSSAFVNDTLVLGYNTNGPIKNTHLHLKLTLSNILVGTAEMSRRLKSAKIVLFREKWQHKETGNVFQVDEQSMPHTWTLEVMEDQALRNWSISKQKVNHYVPCFSFMTLLEFVSHVMKMQSRCGVIKFFKFFLVGGYP